MSSGRSRRHGGHSSSSRRRTTQVSHGLFFVISPSLHPLWEPSDYALLSWDVDHDFYDTILWALWYPYSVWLTVVAERPWSDRVFEHSPRQHHDRTLSYRTCRSNCLWWRPTGFPRTYDHGLDLLRHFKPAVERASRSHTRLPVL